MLKIPSLLNHDVTAFVRMSHLAKVHLEGIFSEVINHNLRMGLINTLKIRYTKHFGIGTRIIFTDLMCANSGSNDSFALQSVRGQLNSRALTGHTVMCFKSQSEPGKQTTSHPSSAFLQR